MEQKGILYNLAPGHFDLILNQISKPYCLLQGKDASTPLADFQLFKANQAFIELFGVKASSIQQHRLSWILNLLKLNITSEIKNQLQQNGHFSIFLEHMLPGYNMQLFFLNPKVLLLIMKSPETPNYQQNIKDKTLQNDKPGWPDANGPILGEAQKAEESEQKYRIIFNHSPSGLLYYDKNLTIKDCNQKFADVLEAPREKLLGLDMNTLQDTSVLPALKTITKNQEGYYEGAYETTISKKRIYIRLKSKPVANSNGEVISGIGIVEEISRNISAAMKAHLRNERLAKLFKQIEQKNEELQEINAQLTISEKRFRQLAENMNDVFWLASNNKFIFLNDAFERVWGLNARQVKENQLLLLNAVHDQDKSRVKALFQPDWEQNKLKSEYIYRIHHASGNTKWLWTRRYPVQEGGKEMDAAITSDITELKNTEEHLINAMKKAEESDQLKTAFLANISHEIRTPLNSILGFSETLMMDPQTKAENLEHLQIIYNSGRQLLNIIIDLVEIAKIEAGQLTISLGKCNINKLIDDIKAEMPGHLRTYGREGLRIYVRKGLSNSEAIVYTDDVRIKQILNNLLNNAIKYTEKGNINFGYSLRNNTLEFFVSDSGKGIPEDKHNLVFERFRQLDSTNTGGFGGTGLGLTIAKAFTQLLDGEIWLTSTPGKGSTFYFSIPYKKADTNTPNAEAENTEIRRNWQDKVLLIVEDNFSNFRLLKTLLKTTKVNILHAKTGEEALEKVKTAKPHAILMDIQLPGISGTQTMQEIKRSYKALPIIAQTAYAMVDDKDKFLNQGFDAYIAKPISRQKLLFLLDDFMA